MTRLRQLLEHAAQYAAKQFAHVGIVHPMWFVETKDGRSYSFHANDEKRLMIAKVRILFKMDGVERYAFIDEAWTLSTNEASEISAARRTLHSGGTLERFPGRTESIVILAEDKTTTIHGRIEISRPRRQRAVLAPLHVAENVRAVTGLMTGLLRD
jgi:hypothetical protein